MSTQISKWQGALFLGFPMILVVLLASSVSHAQTKPVMGWDEAEVATFDDWLTAFEVPPAKEEDEVAQVNKTFSVDDGESTFVLDVMPATAARRVQPGVQALYGLHITGSVTLKSGRSLVRVILVDAASKEHLVYEAYPLIVTNPSFPLTRVCEETCFLEALQGASIRIELIDAAVTLSEVVNLTAPLPLPSTVAAAQQQIKQAQNAVRIRQIQQQIKDKGLKWAAGETPIASLPFDEKRKFFGIPADLLAAPPEEDIPLGIDPIIRNLQGAEYYRGGVFEFDAERQGQTSPIAPQSNGLIESFDWRERHGANNPNSPYYDGDPDGSGWMTSVKNQGGCGSCWAFAPTGATEALANLYFNQHLDLDLAEQDALSCSGGGSCRGGYPSQALDYFTLVGVVDEACFPYTASDQPCANKCANPSEIIKITGREPFGFTTPRTEEQLKRWIIERGPPSAGIYSWGHTMALVGYEKDPDNGETIWIFKNSWGRYWGEKGYLRTKVSLSDMGWTHSLVTPVVSSTQDEISCVDHDGDGFYNWGISEAKPPNCPANAAPEKDCDDSNARLGPFESNGNCSVIGSKVVNEQLALTHLTMAYDPTAVPDAPAGVFTITATFMNASSTPIRFPFFQVTKLTGGSSPSGGETIRIEALIDGRSQLILRGNTAQWHHFDYEAPGRHALQNVPTVVNGVEWFPVWPDMPDASNLFCDCFSDTFTGVIPPLPRSTDINVRSLRSRFETSVVQNPIPSNDFTLIIEYNDNPPGGSDIYITEIDVQGAGNVLLNANGGAGGVGATLTANVGDDHVLSSGESFITDFKIGLQTLEPFSFFVNILGEAR